MSPWLMAAAILAALLACSLTLSLVGLALFMRSWSRLLADRGEEHDPDLAYGSWPVVLVAALRATLRAPRLIRVGLVLGLAHLAGVDPVSTLSETEIRLMLWRKPDGR